MNSPISSPRAGGSIWRFGLQSLLILVGLLAALLAWWRDHHDLATQIELQRMRLESLESTVRKSAQSRGSGGGMFGAAKEIPLEATFASLSEYLHWVETSEKRAEVEKSFWPLQRSAWAEEALPPLLQMLQADSSEQRRRAAYAFRQVHTAVDAVVPQLVPLLDDADREVQRCALIAIQQHGQSATAATVALRRHAESQTSPIAAEALTTLALIEPFVDIGPDLIPLLAHEDEMVRIQAIRAIPMHLPADQAELLLAPRFSGETRKVRAEIARAINEARTGVSNLEGS